LHIFIKMADFKKSMNKILDDEFCKLDDRIIEGAKPKEINGRITSFIATLNGAKAAGIDVGFYYELANQAWGPYFPQVNNAEVRL
jgi:hypothetical protein